MIEAVLRKQQQSLDDLSADFYDSMADSLVDAALDGDIQAIQNLADALIDRGIVEA